MNHTYMISIPPQTEFKVYSAHVTGCTLSWSARNVSYLHDLHSATMNLRWTLHKSLASPCHCHLSSEAYNTLSESDDL